ncbi:MAG TPA: PilZ domain-containing protein [Polyangia bacterium]|nr:PilZ domain-containing protein [Polyangia bacterium]
MHRQPTAVRLRPRVAARFLVRYCIEGAEHELRGGVATDLSEAGLFLHDPYTASLELGTRLHLGLDAGGGELVAAAAVIVHRRSEGCGLRFEWLTPEHQRRLAALLDSRRREIFSSLLRQTQRELARRPA